MNELNIIFILIDILITIFAIKFYIENERLKAVNRRQYKELRKRKETHND